MACLRQLPRFGRSLHLLTTNMVPKAQRSVTTYSQGEYLIRKAREDDYDGIRDASRQAHKAGYETDYMSGMLAQYMQDKNRLIYVAERNRDKKIIGSVMALGGLDDGQTFHGEAGRSVPQYQNMGIMGRLVLSMNEEFNTRWPQWDDFKGSSTQTKFYDGILDTIEMHIKRFALRIKLNRKQLEQFVSEKISTEQKILDLSPTQYADVLNSEHLSQYFYPEGYIVMEHNVMRTWTSNIPFITDYHSDMLMSGDVTSHDAGLSIGGLMSVNDEKSWRYNLNYSGAINEHICKQHLRHALHHNMDELCKRDYTYVIIMVPISFKEIFTQDELIKSWGVSLGVDKLDDITGLTQYCFRYISGVRARLVSLSDLRRRNNKLTEKP